MWEFASGHPVAFTICVFFVALTVDGAVANVCNTKHWSNILRKAPVKGAEEK